MRKHLNIHKLLTLLRLKRRKIFFHTPVHYIDSKPVTNFDKTRRYQENSLEKIHTPKKPEGPLLNIYFLRPSDSKSLGECWSNWGQGLLASNGRYYFAVGNHIEKSGLGDTYLYEYFPETQSLVSKLNLRQITRDPSIACGKIHGHICEGSDHNLYFASYWGQELMDEIKSGQLLGTALYKFNPRTNKTEFLEIPYKGAVARAAKIHKPTMWFYMLTLPEHKLLIYDLHSQRLVYKSPEEYKIEGHDLCIDDQGNALFVLIGGQAAIFRRDTLSIETTALNLKKDLKPQRPIKHRFFRTPFIRYSYFYSRSHAMMCLTNEGRLFTYSLKDRCITDYGYIFKKCFYIASAALSQDQKYLYFIPGSLSEAPRLGVPIVRFDIANRTHEILAELGSTFEEEFNYKIGGAFSTSLHFNEKDLFLVCNGCSLKGQNKKNCPPYGQPVFIHIPLMS